MQGGGTERPVFFFAPFSHTTHINTHPFPSPPTYHTELVALKILTSEAKITDTPVKVTVAQWEEIGPFHASWLVELGGIDGSGFVDDE